MIAIDPHALLRLALPLAWIAGGWTLGWVVERVAIARLRKFASRTTWEGDDVLVAALHGLVRTAFLLIGIHFALVSWPLTPAFGELAHKILAVVAILVATVMASRVFTGFLRVYTRGVEGVVPSTSIFISLARITTIVIGVLIALQSVGISIAPILTALGVGGLATALALQPTLSNLFSGIQILASRAIKPGDFIRLNSGEEGYVHDISWRIATIRTMGNNLILVPNAKLADAVVTNFDSVDSELALVIPMGVAYGSDMEKVERVTMAVAREIQLGTAGAVENFEPVIRFMALADSAIQFNVILRVKAWGDQGLVRHAFLRDILRSYALESIEIPFPQVVVHKPS